jgi:hypothetical protein
MKRLYSVFTLLLLMYSFAFGQSLLEQADALYALRADGFNAQQLLADSAAINSAIQKYQEALATDNGSQKEEITWKLMRAVYFKGHYTTKDSEMKKAIYSQGKQIGDIGLKEYPNSAGINLYSSIIWGVWGEEYGILKAAKEGVAGKIKECCEKTIEIDSTFDSAGGHRVLGRVYFKAPKLWPILSWPSKSEAVKILTKGLKIAPDNLTTQQFLAEAMYSQGQKDGAIKLAQGIMVVSDVREGIVEDAFVKNEVKKLLAAWVK